MALKLARYATGRHKTLSMWDSFHGANLDTIGVGGEALFRRDLGPMMPGGEHLPPLHLAARFFGEDRVRDILTDCTDHDARKLLARFEAELGEHVGPSEQFDDITMMAVCRSEPPLVTDLGPGPDGSS